MTAASWTLDELTRRVGAALVAASDAGTYPGAPNGRVRDVPDQRAIRWYATRGLLDRPTMRGRTAGYGPRHLLQLVVIKRRQAEGRALADIQAEIAGATDAELRALAGLPPDLPPSLLDAAPDEPAPECAISQPAPDGDGQGAPRPRVRFWAGSAPQRPPIADRAAEPDDAVLTGVPLSSDAILLLPAAPDPGDLPAIRAAAAPLLDLLIDRGLLTTARRSPR